MIKSGHPEKRLIPKMNWRLFDKMHWSNRERKESLRSIQAASVLERTMPLVRLEQE